MTHESISSEFGIKTSLPILVPSYVTQYWNSQSEQVSNKINPNHKDRAKFSLQMMFLYLQNPKYATSKKLFNPSY